MKAKVLLTIFVSMLITSGSLAGDYALRLETDDMYYVGYVNL
jgi:hypothetical protein